MTRFQDLAYEQLKDSTIRLEQRGYSGEEAVIDLHPAQLRYVAEQFGLVAPNYPADELSNRLARQLCEIQRELASECHRSPGLDSTFAKLDGYCSSIPDAIFPHDLWDDDEAQANDASAASTGKESNPTTRPEKTQHRANAEAQADSGEQLGLNV